MAKACKNFLNGLGLCSYNQAGICSLSGFVNNFRIVTECRGYLDLLSGRFTSETLVPGHNNIPRICGANELSKAGELLPEFSSIELGMPLASVKLDIERKFSWDANLSWVNEESCFTARLT